MKERLLSVILVSVFFTLSGVTEAQLRAKDPGLRGGRPGAGAPFAILTADELEMFNVGKEAFSEEEAVDDGVGPRFNFVGCAGCHSQPDIGGTSPAVNPLFRVTGDLGFKGNAIQAHRGDANGQFGPSEANAVIDRYNRLDEGSKRTCSTSCARSRTRCR